MSTYEAKVELQARPWNDDSTTIIDIRKKYSLSAEDAVDRLQNDILQYLGARKDFAHISVGAIVVTAIA